ncbi:MAG: F0F1 ATP synthase subunit B [Armatimonadota bacterium]|nr:F0F1 ATP synthase subunit B [Armatimonadota bacterium]
MVDIEWHVLLIQVVSFALTLWLVKVLGWRPLMAHLANRQADIRADYDKADTERRKMEDLRREYDQRISVADTEARERIKAALDRANEQAAQVVTQAQEDARRLTERAQEEVARERQKVLAELRGQVSHLSVAIAGKIIDERLDENKHRAMVDDFISRLGALS